ncbi:MULTISPECIES: phytanoyl-CoA dioxygenase family protein [unclassified Imperialibacter]|uniref:phytanoyl-CoA dioxygenase family protein n=1 Tax=unclassified Imperialibacter TaxID=2629706 RepID=UPI00125887B9|nr:MULTISPECIES: phytanoyl-CoA dioxygenase family protein [unclassified Imperialibacter]CAD5254039.1 Phytanoyl-CoA dioxygenase [Imperialibacter sp. 89]CAD5275007.1 Phytanoyl-CoA dioxygenase [Imperialibacter sp. 75]VVT19369.1 Phytanoyl-CoA dioxygenase [Imperialibacter sp. EC-SDR9]
MSSVADLAGVHELVSRLFEWPETEKEWEQYKLSDEQVAFFKENGYLANVKLLNSIQVESLRNELEEIADPNHPGHHLFYEFHSNESTDPSKVLFHALGAWRVTPGFHDVLWNPAFVMAASQLLGGSVRFWHDQLFCKPAKHGGVVAWHQDYSYWTRTKPMEHLTCWVGLDDADVDNGCLYYVPGSHRWGLLDKPDLAGDMNGLDQYLTEEQKSQFKPIPIEMKMGHGTFHHPLLVHGSYENKTDRQRRAYVTNVFKDGTRSDADTPLLSGADVVPQGQKMEGKFFPLLYRA